MHYALRHSTSLISLHLCSKLVTRERTSKGDDAANQLQLKLLEGEQLDEERNGLAVLRSL